MKLAAVIAEYNPFHNGHHHHLNLTRSLAGATHIMVLMSGGFVQRGEPAVTDKWTRAGMAIKGGADLVCELPYIFAGAGAEAFADGAVAILNAAQAVDVLSFGSECDNVQTLKIVADALCDEPDNMRDTLKHCLKQGMGFAAARENAMSDILGEDTAAILKSPNNILAVEYLKAMRKQRCDFTAFAVKRAGAGHHAAIPGSGSISSAKSIRACLTGDDFLTAARYVPYPADTLKAMPVKAISENYENALLARLTACDLKDIRALPDVSEGLEFAIKNALKIENHIEGIVDTASSKRVPKSRVRRALAYLMMAAGEEKINTLRGASPYLRVLALNKKGKDIIKLIKSRSDMPILTNLRANQTKLCSVQKEVLAFDIKATDLQSLFSGNFCYHKDYTTNPVLNIEKLKDEKTL